jgi:hypothetical protein
VGSIGYESAGAYIDGEANHSGLSFQAPNITPRYNGSITDDTVHLGSTSNRFKDLYLSNGIVGNSNSITISTDGGTSDHVTVDTSGNLLVGKTSSSSSIDGATIFNTGFVASTVTQNTEGSGAVSQFRRNSTDGDILDFRKDGSNVGSIGVDAGDNLYIGSNAANHGGIYMNDNGVLPMSAGAVSDNTRDLGSMAFRWNDLFLGGGVYLGGTGSANKLTDYEEGSWTPTIGSGSFTYQNARYVKVGDMVTVCANIADITDNTTTSGVQVGGLPFTTVAASQTVGSVMFRYVDAPTNMIQLTPLVNASSSTLIFYWSSSTGATWDGLQYADAKYTNWDMIISITYRAAG